MLQRTHHRCMDANVERFKAIEIARRIEQPIKGFRVGALRGGEAGDGAIRFGDDAESVGGVVDKARRFAVQFGVKFAGEGFTLGYGSL